MEKMLERLIGENVRVHMKAAPDLRLVNVDPNQIEQVILNLVVNARDALPNGGNITIETSNVYLDEEFSKKHLAVECGHYILLCVSDDGLGMDASTASRIFEPFFTTKPIGKGTGLGLTTTYGIIKQSKGTIWVYSELGKGTVFKIYLPVSEKSESQIEKASNKPILQGGGQTILLVEDDEMLREGFAEVLEHKGYKVLVASNGHEALNICESYKDVIHMLLTDVVMPGMGGFELAKKAFVMRSEMSILFMSGYTDAALENAGLDHMGPLNFIQKLFGVSALIAKLQDVLYK
jgi:two-component system, cell cycle sensor histidine kinase and response regulator CckA